MIKKKVFSGIQPSGDIHIGNYLGAIKGWVDLQDEFDSIFCVVDLHTITIKQDPKVLNKKIREVTGIYLASGIDPKKSSIFVQSHVPAHSEMTWILNCFTPMGWMERMTQFKEKSKEKRERVSVGLFDYPALMAADILLYDTDVVPVGNDQVQHVELTRDIAKRFNSIYGPSARFAARRAGEAGEVFKIPEVKIKKETARIMGLQHPENKMSKSSVSEMDRIGILDSSEDIQSKILKATTDSQTEIVFDNNRTSIYNLLSIYEAFSNKNREEIENKFEGKGYADFKKDLADLVVEKLKPIQEEYKKISEDQGYIDKVLEDGLEKVLPIAESKLKEVKNIVGLG